MNFTNKYFLPAELSRALIGGERKLSQEFISCTQLIGSPRLRQLRTRYDSKLEEDVSDRLWALLGTAVHLAIEHHEGLNSLAEERLRAQIDGLMLTGIADIYHDQDGGTVEDWKTVSIYSFLLGEKPAWERQLNVYAYLFRQAHFPVAKLKINAILRDWMKSKAEREPDTYPPCPFKQVEIPVWPEEKIDAYVKDRIALHLAAKDMADNDLPPCTAEERWEKPTTYAIMKPKAKRAVKVCSSEAEADMNRTGDQIIVKRPGSSTFCESYCAVRGICNIRSQFVKEETE